MIRSAFGYAVIDEKGEVLIKTVSDSQRAAKLNWLVAVARVWINDVTTDVEINRAWLHNKGDAECVRVQIDPVLDA